MLPVSLLSGLFYFFLPDLQNHADVLQVFEESCGSFSGFLDNHVEVFQAFCRCGSFSGMKNHMEGFWIPHYRAHVEGFRVLAGLSQLGFVIC